MKRILAIVALLAVTAAAYAPGLSGPLLFDDFHNLVPFGEWIRGLRDWKWVILSNSSGTLGRPISMGSLMLDLVLFGNSVMALKASNIAFHLINGLLVWLLFRDLARATRAPLNGPGRNEWMPIVAAGIWMLHPLLVSTVLYVIQRMALLSTLFTLLAMLAYLHGRLALVNGARRKFFALMVGAALATVCATLSKENGALAPSLCAIIELFVFAPAAGKVRPWPSRAFIAVGLVVPAIVAVVLVAVAYPFVVSGYENRPFTLSERLLTQPRVLWDYVGSFMLPNGPRLGLFHDDYPVSTGLTTPASTLAAILCWAALVVVAWRVRRRIPGFALGIGIFIVGHALESSIFPLLMYFEHRNYLPAIGLAWATVSLLFFLGQGIRAHLDRPALLFSFASVALMATLAGATWARAGVWSSHEAILEQGLRQHPESKWARMDAIRHVLSQPPPDYLQARVYIDSLVSSRDPESRRAGAAWGLMWSCLQDQAPRKQDTVLAFGGSARTIEADLLSVFEAWGTLVRVKGCPEFSLRNAADHLAMLADNTTVPQHNKNVRRIRYKSAELYLKANVPQLARDQATRAYTGSLEDAPVAGLIAILDIASGRFEDADRRIAYLDRTVPHYDRPNREMIKVLKDYLEGEMRDAGRQSRLRETRDKSP